ncbi:MULTISPECIES: MHYT domain-containing protein [unclassified Streptomyces]|uniref:MHYT domain-containing protein n=1 Tax=unclassified Streptomyces TaxID=2593676 RepID=UPI0033B62BF9
MNGTIDGFSYGLVTPVAAYVMACVGSALGLRCVVRTVHHEPGWRLGWLALGASALGCGIWTMHFIAMTGFSVAETPITYDVPLTVLSLVVAIVVVSAGVFIVGHRGATRAALTVGGAITGLGVAMMHYLGMFAMQLNGELRYNVFTVALSLIVALVAATAALWAAVSVKGFVRTLGASLVMGLAVTGMHYTGMAAVSVHLHNTIGSAVAGQEGSSLLLPMLLGPIIFLILAAAVVMFDPVLMLGDGNWDKPAKSRSRSRSKVVARGNAMPVQVPGIQDAPAPMAYNARQANQWSSASPQWPADEHGGQYSDAGAGDSYGTRHEAE